MNFFKSIFMLFSVWTTDVFSTQQVNLNILVKQNNVELLEQDLYEISNPYSERYGDYYTNEEIND